MGTLDEILSGKGGTLAKLFDLMEGREVRTVLDLNDVQFRVGKNTIRLKGEIELTVVRPKKK